MEGGGGGGRKREGGREAGSDAGKQGGRKGWRQGRMQGGREGGSDGLVGRQPGQRTCGEDSEGLNQDPDECKPVARRLRGAEQSIVGSMVVT